MLPELRTIRLTLRELSPEHAPAMQSLQNCSYMWRQSAVEPAEFADAAARIANYQKYRGADSERRLFVWVACRRGEVIGSGSLARGGHRQIGSLSTFVAESLSGHGFATELGRRLVDFGFAELGLNRIEADVAVENVASQRVMDKIGLRREGVARDCIWAQGRWWTEAKYAILAADVAVLRPALGKEIA